MTLFGINIDVRFIHDENEYEDSVVKPSFKTMLVKPAQPSNALFPIVFKPSLNIINLNPLHPE